MKARFFLSAIVLLVHSMQPAHADPPDYKLGAKFKVQTIFEDNRDLGTRETDPTKSLAFDFQPDLKLYLTQDISAYTEGRFVKILGDDGVQEDNGQIAASDQFAELRELWVNFDNLFKAKPLSLKIGHQRIREDRNLFWNDDLDAVKLSYDTEKFAGALGVINNFAAYRTSEEDYRREDEERLRIFGEGSWQYHLDHFLEARSLYEHDYSGTDPIGTTVARDNRDDTDFDLLWLGLRSKGEVKAPAAPLNMLRYRADIIGVWGDETASTTSSTSNPTFRTVTANTDRDVRAWAFDGGVDLFLKAFGDPILTFNYAYGSGDDDAGDGTNQAYRSTDMNGYTSTYGGSSKSLHNYGEAFRPDLSNLHVLSAGLGIPAFKKGDINLFYHHYIRDEKTSDIGDNRLQANPNDTDNDIGRELDFALNLDLQKQFESVIKLPEKTRFNFSSGVFFPGDAFNGTGANDDAVWRVRAELNFKL